MLVYRAPVRLFIRHGQGATPEALARNLLPNHARTALGLPTRKQDERSLRRLGLLRQHPHADSFFCVRRPIPSPLPRGGRGDLPWVWTFERITFAKKLCPILCP